VSDKNKGLYPKYEVYKTVKCDLQGCGLVHREQYPVEDRVFVLKPDSDPLAREALATYAQAATEAGLTQLGYDLKNWLHELEQNSHGVDKDSSRDPYC
jgi:hypothetical protein